MDMNRYDTRVGAFSSVCGAYSCELNYFVNSVNYVKLIVFTVVTALTKPLTKGLTKFYPQIFGWRLNKMLNKIGDDLLSLEAFAVGAFNSLNRINKRSEFSRTNVGQI